MEYIKLNNKNKINMRSEINSNFNFEWEDSSLINDIIKKIEHIYPTSSDPKKIQDDEKELRPINDLFNKLYDRKITNKEFLKELKINLDRINDEFPDLKYNYKYKYDIYDSIIKKSHRLLINGYAGIGKSYFVYKLEEELDKIKIKHLCVYGKFNSNISLDVFKEISKIDEEFYLVIDALNEFNESEQIMIINELKKLIKKENVNIIVTYRNHTIKKNILDVLQKVIDNDYEFQGVDFESSLLIMIENYGIEVMKYLDVIETNNPLYIIMLNKILIATKLKEEKINGVVQITYIMEFYIKEICGKKYWTITKNIGALMLEKERAYITEEELKSIAGNLCNNYVDKMIENAFMYESNLESNKVFGFTVHELSDYIIARPLFNIISNKSEEEIIEIINNKIKKIYSLSEAVSILVFEKYKDEDIKKAVRIFVKSDLYSNVGIEFLKKISFSNEQINIIQSCFKVSDIALAYRIFGGFKYRPFNCTNYINNILYKHKKYKLDIIERFMESNYLIRLKNIAYSIPFLSDQKNMIYEYFYYSFWLMSAANERIRYLATKVVYDLAFSNIELSEELINNYGKVKDYYIKNGIIHILTMLPKTKKNSRFLKKIYKSKKELDAESIYRISRYFGVEHNIPMLHKKNLYKKLSKKVTVDEKLNLNRIISLADIYEKYVLIFERYPKEENTISFSDSFIINNSKYIHNYNNKLNKKFSCVKDNGYCKYSVGGEKFQNQMYKLNIKFADSRRVFLVFQEIFKDVSKKYNYEYSEEERFDHHINHFENSLLKKVLLISQNILLGSLMTNYYTDEFSVYNDDVTFGYCHYSYIKYDEEKICLAAPISPYNELIDRLNNKMCEKIGLYDERDYEWFKDVNLSKTICSKLTKKIDYNGESWSLIGGSVKKFISDEINEFYSCYMGINPDKYLDGTVNSRYLTIENKDYYGNINEYKNLDYDKNVNIRSFQSNSLDIKESGLSFPSPRLIKILDLHYEPKYSSWNDSDGNIVILCDNNSKKYFEYPISGAIYIKTSILEDLKKKNDIVYWCYTEKLFKKYGWNDEASLHIQLDSEGNIDKVFNNNNLESEKKENNELCEKCKFNFYNKKRKENYNKFLENLDIIVKDYKE